MLQRGHAVFLSFLRRFTVRRSVSTQTEWCRDMAVQTEEEHRPCKRKRVWFQEEEEDAEPQDTCASEAAGSCASEPQQVSLLGRSLDTVPSESQE